MSNPGQEREAILARARDIIASNDNISTEERNATLRLMQAIVEAYERYSEDSSDAKDLAEAFRDTIAPHALIMAVNNQADELDALRRVSLNINSSLDLQTSLNMLATEAIKLVKNAERAHIFLYENERLKFGASFDSDEGVNIPYAMPRPNGLTYFVARNGQTVAVEDIATHPLYRDAFSAWSGSIISVPLKFKGEVIGVMNLSKKVTGKFTNSEQRLINMLADQAAASIFNANLYKRLAETANTDSLTGLPNRRALDERLQEERRFAEQTKKPFAVVMMDLDGFKAINDTFGHNVGDDLLHSLFNFLAQRMRSSDFLARYGGDELTLVMRNTDLEAAQTVTQKAIDLMQHYRFPFPRGKTFELGLSAGIAVYPLHAVNPSDLIRAADSALYYAKRHNRGGFALAKPMTGTLDPIQVTRKP